MSSYYAVEWFCTVFFSSGCECFTHLSVKCLENAHLIRLMSLDLLVGEFNLTLSSSILRSQLAFLTMGETTSSLDKKWSPFAASYQHKALGKEQLLLGNIGSCSAPEFSQGSHRLTVLNRFCVLYNSQICWCMKLNCLLKFKICSWNE